MQHKSLPLFVSMHRWAWDVMSRKAKARVLFVSMHRWAWDVMSRKAARVQRPWGLCTPAESGRLAFGGYVGQYTVDTLCKVVQSDVLQACTCGHIVQGSTGLYRVLQYRPALTFRHTMPRRSSLTSVCTGCHSVKFDAGLCVAGLCWIVWGILLYWHVSVRLGAGLCDVNDAAV